MKSDQSKVLQIVEIGLLMAITILMGTTPYGTIRTPLLSISLVTIPVAVAAIIVGPLGGTICGATFGICSFINALTGASGMMTALFAINPVGTFITAFVPRVLEGLFVSLIFIGLQKIKKMKFASYYLAAICCPLLNTLMFMTSLVLFFYKTDYVQGLVESVGATNPFNFVILLVGVQGIIEAVACLILGGAISQAVSRALKNF